MFNRKIPVILLLSLLFMTECTTWYRLTKKESKYYTPVELNILADTTAAIDFKYGFDPDMKLDYIYMAGRFSDQEIYSKEKNLKDALLKYKPEEVVGFYEKIYRLTEIQTWYMNDYKADEEWAEATLIEKYILPDTKKFLELLEKNVIFIDEKYRNIKEERKRVIKEEVIRDLD